MSGDDSIEERWYLPHEIKAARDAGYAKGRKDEAEALQTSAYPEPHEDERQEDVKQEEILSLAYQLTNELRSHYGFKNGNPVYRALRKIAQAAAKPVWRPIETAPKDSTRILASWPCHPFDDDGDMDESKVIAREEAVTFWSGGHWVEPDHLDAHGARFDEEFCYAPVPSHWMPLPSAPSV